MLCSIKNIFVSVTFIATLIRLVTTSLVYEIMAINSIVRAADEKLIINELGLK